MACAKFSHNDIDVMVLQLRDAIHSKVKESSQEIDMSKWFTRTALELIGQSGLGKFH